MALIAYIIKICSTQCAVIKRCALVKLTPLSHKHASPRVITRINVHINSSLLLFPFRLVYIFSQLFWFIFKCFGSLNVQNVSLSRKWVNADKSREASHFSIFGQVLSGVILFPAVFKNRPTPIEQLTRPTSWWTMITATLRQVKKKDRVFKTTTMIWCHPVVTQAHYSSQNNLCTDFNINCNGNQTTSFNKWFCNTKHLCKNI